MIENFKSRFGLKYATLLLVILVVGGLLLYQLRNSSAKDLDEIVDSGRLRVVTDNGMFGFIVEKDTVYGFQYELIKAFADSLGLELEITERDDVRSIIYDLMEGEYDVYTGFIPQTTEYLEKVLFTNAVQVNRQLLVQQNTDTTRLVINQMGLKGMTISLPKNSPYKMLVDHLSDQIADTIFVNELRSSSLDVSVKMVSDGLIEYTLCPELLAEKYMNLYPNLSITLPVGYPQSIVWSVNNKSTDLQLKLNEFLNDFIGSEEYWRIYRKYYNE